MHTTPDSRLTATALREKLLTIFVAPDEVFEEVVAAPPNPACWLVPVFLVFLAAFMSLLVAPVREPRAAEVRQLAEASAIVSSETEKHRLLPAAVLTVATSTVAGTFWSAFVLWFIGRMFLKTRFPFRKSMEVVGLTGMILALGTLITALLIAATGDASARPALSLLAGQYNAGTRLHAALEVVNFFHLWTAAVLATGLSKLARVSFNEAAFWVFGYWVALRVAIVCLV